MTRIVSQWRIRSNINLPLVEVSETTPGSS
jgi:hypothetical protein